MIKLKTQGLNRLALKFKWLPEKIKRGLNIVLNRTGLEMRDHILTNMINTPKDTSRRYKVNKKGYHSPSFPGNFPAVKSSKLISSIIIENIINGVEVGYISGKSETVPYAKALEYGTSNMDYRPFIYPTWKKFEPIVLRRIKRYVKGNV